MSVKVGDWVRVKQYRGGFRLVEVMSVDGGWFEGNDWVVRPTQSIIESRPPHRGAP